MPAPFDAEPQIFGIYSITGMRGRRAYMAGNLTQSCLEVMPIWERDLVSNEKALTRTMTRREKGLAGKDNQSEHRRLANVSAAGILLCEWHN